ncbi:hypothetical protein ANO11243_056240 [Dothideomycetidae sp. 11243]|nr:hypothetical protein ANO11243_056240 [fungal sp. No.11243]
MTAGATTSFIHADAPGSAIGSKKSRVRTGCLTCRIRKVKCDEAKPACERCTSTGRKCDGYAGSRSPAGVSASKNTQALSFSRTAKRPHIIAVRPQADANCLSGVLSAEECRWVLYFSQVAAPAISDLADGDFWTNLVPQISCSEPAIRNALLALGSTYTQMEAAASSGQPTNKIVASEHSIRHYNKAIAQLRQYLDSESAMVEAPLICCLIFICLESLFSGHDSLMHHLRSGIAILNSPRFRATGFSPAVGIKRRLEQILRRVDAQSTLFGNPVSTRMIDLDQDFPLTVVGSPPSDLVQAAATFNHLAALCLNFAKAFGEGTFADFYPGFSPYTVQTRLQEQLLQWKTGLKDLDHDQLSSPSLMRLRIQYSAVFVYLCTCLELDEARYDAYMDEFATIVRLATVLSESTIGDRSSQQKLKMNGDPTNPSALFSLNAYTNPPLWLVATKCRDFKLRCAAIELLEKCPTREGLWNAKMHARIARRVVELEEAPPALNPAALGMERLDVASSASSDGCREDMSMLPGRTWVCNVDLKELPDLTTGRVVFQSYLDDVDGPWSMWQEDV